MGGALCHGGGHGRGDLPQQGVGQHDAQRPHDQLGAAAADHHRIFAGGAVVGAGLQHGLGGHGVGAHRRDLGLGQPGAERFNEKAAYPAALAAGLLCLGGLALTSALGELRLWAAYLLFCFQPTLVWLCCGGWFTELGLNAVLPFQESLATAANLIILGAGVVWALRCIGRKDVNP